MHPLLLYFQMHQPVRKKKKLTLQDIEIREIRQNTWLASSEPSRHSANLELSRLAF